MANLSQSLSLTVSPGHFHSDPEDTCRSIVQGHFHHAKVSLLGVLVHLIHQNKMVLLGR